MANGVALTAAERKALGLTLSPAQQQELREAKAVKTTDKKMQTGQVRQDNEVSRGLAAILKRLRG